jgi:hypothetical protein
VKKLSLVVMKTTVSERGRFDVVKAMRGMRLVYSQPSLIARNRL